MSGSGPASKAFQYRMTAPQRPSGEKVSYRSEKRSAPLERPVIRPLVKTGGKPVLDERQGRLRLDRSGSMRGSASRPRAREPERAEEQTVFPEILFSRLLGGLIDVVVAAIVGGAAGILTAHYTEAGVFSEGFVRDVSLTAGVFFLFSSTFLLYLSGQTLGMVATELRLVADDRKSPRLSDIVLRVLSFPLVTASLIGLVWALFDRRQLCWHDHLSKTRVVPTHSYL